MLLDRRIPQQPPGMNKTLAVRLPSLKIIQTGLITLISRNQNHQDGNHEPNSEFTSISSATILLDCSWNGSKISCKSYLSFSTIPLKIRIPTNPNPWPRGPSGWWHCWGHQRNHPTASVRLGGFGRWGPWHDFKFVVFICWFLIGLESLYLYAV